MSSDTAPLLTAADAGYDSASVPRRRELFNVVVLGLSFLLIMASFQTSSFFQGGILKDQGYKDLGLTTLGLLQACFAVSNLLAPHAILKLGPRVCMMLGGTLYVLMLASLIDVNKAAFITASAFNGVGAALLWTAEGAAITRSSSPQTRGRNAGIFWALLQMSLFVGSGVALAVVPSNDEAVTPATARTLYICLTALCSCGVLSFLGLRLAPAPKDAQHNARSVVESVRETLSLFRIWRMNLLCVLIFFGGLYMSFWQGQFPLIVGNKDDRIPLPSSFKPSGIGYLMIVVGSGEVLGSLVFGRLSDRHGRWPVMLIGLGLIALCFFAIYAVMVAQVVTPTPAMALAIGFFLGVIDSIINTQLFAILGAMFPDRSADAFAVNYIARALASTLAFYTAPHFCIEGQLLLMFFLAIIGTYAFVAIDRRLQSEPNAGTVISVLN